MDGKRIAYSILAGLGILAIYDIVRGYKALKISLSKYEITKVNLDGSIGMTLYFDITNPLLIGVTLRGIEGMLTATNYGSDPVTIGTVANRYNYYIRWRARHIIKATVNVDTKSAVKQLLQNIQSGDVNNLLITFSGDISFGKDKEIAIPVSKNMSLTEFVK